MNFKNSAVLARMHDRNSAVCDAEAAKKQHLKPSVISSPTMETDFAQLEDGSLVEMIEDPENPSRAVFLLYKDGQARIVDHVQTSARILKPRHREAEIIRHVRLPRGVKQYGSLERLFCRMNEEIFSRCLDLENNSRFLLACFVLSTWFVDSGRMPVAPYLALVGLPASGKSTVLRVLRLLCRRSLLTADISSAAFYSACERLTPTLLIDETATAGNSRELFHLLKTGTSRDVVTLRKDASFHAYGAKVVAWNELPNDPALNSRCIIIPMHETTRQDLKNTNDPEIVAVADDLQQQLLHYRLEKLNSVTLPQVANSEVPLGSRFRDLYKALGLAIAEDADYAEWLQQCVTSQRVTNREPLSPNHAAVLQTLYKTIHLEDQQSEVRILDLTTIVNADLKASGESRRLAPRAVGSALTALGINARARSNQGWFVFLTRDAQKLIHNLVREHGLDNQFFLPPLSVCKKCDLCDLSNDLRTFSGFPTPPWSPRSVRAATASQPTW